VRDGEIVLPIARLRRTEVGSLAFDQTYIPPLLTIGGSDALVRLVDRLVTTLDAKSAALAPLPDRATGGSGSPSYALSEVASFWLRHAIHASVAPLRHMLVGAHVHPEQLYIEFARLAGALCTFAVDARPRDLPAYDHDDPGPCFAALDRLIRELLEWNKPEHFIRIPLERATLRYESSQRGAVIAVEGYRAAVTDDRAFATTQWILGVRASMPTAQLVARVPTSLKVCSASGVAYLVGTALPGSELTHLQIPPAAIDPRPDTLYFAIKRSKECEALMRSGREIAAYVPDSIPNPSIELLVVIDS
jgi:type VI secretion system protein ImpJ